MQSFIPEVNKLSTIPQGLPFVVQLIILLGEYSLPEIEGFVLLNDGISQAASNQPKFWHNNCRRDTAPIPPNLTAS
jgi:hypothetical protein